MLIESTITQTPEVMHPSVSPSQDATKIASSALSDITSR